MKEWAYAGFAFVFIGAGASHMGKRNYSAIVGPIMSLLMLAASYLY